MRGHGQQIEKIGFCAGCNALRTLISETCPECGEELTAAEPPYDLGVTTTLDAERLSDGGLPQPAGTSDDDLVGTEVGGYRIEELAGTGGMAVVKM